MSFQTINELFEQSVSKYAKLSLSLEKVDSLKGKPINLKLSFAEIRTQSRKLADVLESFGHLKADPIAIWAYNSSRWIIADLAIMKQGAASLGIHPDASDDELVYILKTTQVKTIFIQDQKFLNKLKRISAVHKLPLVDIIILDPKLTASPEAFLNVRIHLWEPLLAKEPSRSATAEKILVGAEDIACIAVSAGTETSPRLVPISHKALLMNVLEISKTLAIGRKEVYLAVNSFAILTEKLLSFYNSFLRGFSLYIPTDIRAYLADLESKNVAICSVSPRVLNQIQERIFIDLNSRPLLKFLMKVPLLDIWARSEIRKSLAPQLKFFICYGDILSPRLEAILKGYGMKVVHAYSLVEAAGIVALSSPSKSVSASAGKILKNNRFKTITGGELLLAGDNLIRSYYADSSHGEAFIYEDEETWFRTGDVATVKQQQVFISGRIKDTITTKAGKKVLINRIEALLEGIPYVIDAVLVGQGKEFVSALISVNEEVFRLMYQKIDKYSITRQCEIDVAAINQILNDFEQVRKFVILDQSLSVARGELTSTLKKTRQVIHDNYREKIEAIYS